MTVSPTNMREIADKIQNLLDEAEKANDKMDSSTEKKSLDDLLTEPASSAKIADHIDKNTLVKQLDLDMQKGNNLWSAIENLSKEAPVINQENAQSILFAFYKIAPKISVSENQIFEKYNRNFDDPISYSHVEAAIKDASQVSPKSKDLALKLAVALTTGSRNRKMDAGLEGVLNAVVYAIDLAKAGHRSELLHLIDDFDIKYEGNDDAFDQNAWPSLITSIKGLSRELLAASKESSSN